MIPSVQMSFGVKMGKEAESQLFSDKHSAAWLGDTQPQHLRRGRQGSDAMQVVMKLCRGHHFHNDVCDVSVVSPTCPRYHALSKLSVDSQSKEKVLERLWPEEDQKEEKLCGSGLK